LHVHVQTVAHPDEVPEQSAVVINAISRRLHVQPNRRPSFN
jgi:hypothetical protein